MVALTTFWPFSICHWNLKEFACRVIVVVSRIVIEVVLVYFVHAGVFLIVVYFDVILLI